MQRLCNCIIENVFIAPIHLCPLAYALSIEASITGQDLIEFVIFNVIYDSTLLYVLYLVV